MLHNRFGAIADLVLRKFALSGYTPTEGDFGGADAVADALDDGTNAILQAIPTRVRDCLTFPDLQIIESRASAGQTTAFLKLTPAIAGKVHLWRGQPAQFTSRPVLVTDAWDAQARAYTPMMGAPGALVELPESAFTVTPASGLVSLAAACQRNDMLLASYEVDTASASYQVPSLADLVATGAAAMLGAKVYPQATSEWQHVKGMGEAFVGTLERLGKGEWVPPELRVVRWWAPPEPDQGNAKVGSVRRFRA